MADDLIYNVTEGQRVLVDSICNAFDNLTEAPTDEQKAKVQEMMLVYRLPLTFEDGVKLAVELDNVGLQTTSKLMGAFADLAVALYEDDKKQT